MSTRTSNGPRHCDVICCVKHITSVIHYGYASCSLFLLSFFVSSWTMTSFKMTRDMLFQSYEQRLFTWRRTLLEIQNLMKQVVIVLSGLTWIIPKVKQNLICQCKLHEVAYLWKILLFSRQKNKQTNTSELKYRWKENISRDLNLTVCSTLFDHLYNWWKENFLCPSTLCWKRHQLSFRLSRFICFTVLSLLVNESSPWILTAQCHFSL